MARPFWLEGVRFECQGTGRCCKSRGRYGWIYLTLEDRQRLAALLGMKTGQFTRRHCERTDGPWHLRQPERDWRTAHPNLKVWFDHISARRSVITATSDSAK